MKQIFLVSLLVLSGYSYAYDPFDSMRCAGKLMSSGTKIESVIEYCGDPYYRNNQGNQYASYSKVTYETNGRGRYFMLFKNGFLIKSKHKIYGASKTKWQMPY